MKANFAVLIQHVMYVWRMPVRWRWEWNVKRKKSMCRLWSQFTIARLQTLHKNTVISFLLKAFWNSSTAKNGMHMLVILYQDLHISPCSLPAPHPVSSIRIPSVFNGNADFPLPFLTSSFPSLSRKLFPRIIPLFLFLSCLQITQVVIKRRQLETATFQ